MSTLHHGYCTFAVHDENSFVPAFFKVFIDHLFDNLQSGNMNSDQDNVEHDKCVILSEIVNFSNLFQHIMYYYSV